MRQMTLIIVLVIAALAAGRSLGVLDAPQDPIPGPVGVSGQPERKTPRQPLKNEPLPGLILIDGQQQQVRRTPRPFGPPLLDVSADVRLSIIPTRDHFEQLEPIKLRIELANLSKGDMTFDAHSECHQFGFDIVNLTHNLAIEEFTNYGKLQDDGTGRANVVLKPGDTQRFTVYPNLCIDMTAPRLYSIVATMELRRPSDGRRCFTRSKPIRVEVTSLRKGR